MKLEQEVFIASDRALNDIIQQITNEQWEFAIPAWFQTGRKQENMTLRTIVNYHAFDDAWVPDVLSGMTAAEVGAKYDGDLLGSDPRASFLAIVDKAVAAVEECKDLDQTTHLSYGDFPARDYLTHISMFRGFRVYDIAKLIGANTKMSDDLVQGLWDILSPHEDEYRAMGVFRPKVEVPADADLQTRLLAMSGRMI